MQKWVSLLVKVQVFRNLSNVFLLLFFRFGPENLLKHEVHGQDFLLEMHEFWPIAKTELFSDILKMSEERKADTRMERGGKKIRED